MSPIRRSRPWWMPIVGLFLAVETSRGQDEAPCPHMQPKKPGLLRRTFGGVGRKVHEDFIGDPAYFAEPPLGASVNANFNLMRNQAAPHRFTLYRSDFLVDSTTLSPSGASRMGRIVRGADCWLGPVVVEPTDDRPGLAEARREAVMASLRGIGMLAVADRVVIGPGVGPGGIGAEAANTFNTVITRSQTAQSQYVTTPNSGASLGGSTIGGN